MKKILFIILSLVCLNSFGQGGRLVVNGWQQSTPSITFVAETGIGSTDGNPVTTGSMNTTGATLLVAAVSSYSAVGAPTVSDSKGNTWVARTAYTNAAEAVRVQLFYCYSPTVGSGHTFSTSAGTNYPAIRVLAFSGTTGSYDAENGNDGASPLATGTVTPASNGEVIIAALGANYTTALTSITAGFTNYDLPNNVGGSFFLSMAYYVQPTAGAQGCTFTWTASAGANTGAAAIAAFK